jgi:hypothetical protein
VQLVAQKSRDDKPYINASLNVVVSIEASPPTYYISKTIGISKYLLSKAILWKIHVDMIGKNIWGTFHRSMCFDDLSENDCQLILEFWEMATTIS